MVLDNNLLNDGKNHDVWIDLPRVRVEPLSPERTCSKNIFVLMLKNCICASISQKIRSPKLYCKYFKMISFVILNWHQALINRRGF